MELATVCAFVSLLMLLLIAISRPGAISSVLSVVGPRLLFLVLMIGYGLLFVGILSAIGASVSDSAKISTIPALVAAWFTAKALAKKEE